MSVLELLAFVTCGLTCGPKHGIVRGGQEQATPPVNPPAATAPAPAAEPEKRSIDVRVDRRVELLTLVARLAGFEEFNQPTSNSPYSRAAEAWFREQRDHPAVKRLRELRRTSGVSYDAIASLAVHLEDSVDLEERIPFDTPPERLDARWGGVKARLFLVELRDFVKVANSEGFFDGQEPLFASAAERLRAVIEKSRALPWFDRFFGARTGATYVAIPGLLCGGGNSGEGIRYPDGRDEEILPVFGCSSFDAEGIPTFGAEMAGLFVHELCHSYTNALVDRIGKAIDPPAQALFESAADAMKQQAYSNGRTVAYESLVRACVVRCRTVTEGEAAGKAQLAEEVGRGFAWLPALAAEIARFEGDRKQWPTFVDFLPQIVACFEREAERVKAAAEKAPRLVSISPRSGRTDVEAGDGQIVLQFDREMQTTSWSLVGDPAATPKSRGDPKWAADGRVVTFPVTLEPGRKYHFWLNRGAHQGFKSREGFALAPVEVEFTTKGTP
jgi:hypothetical protein